MLFLTDFMTWALGLDVRKSCFLIVLDRYFSGASQQAQDPGFDETVVVSMSRSGTQLLQSHFEIGFGLVLTPQRDQDVGVLVAGIEVALRHGKQAAEQFGGAFLIALGGFDHADPPKR